MSWLPSPGSIVKLNDGRIGTISKIPAPYDVAYIRFDDGSEEPIGMYDIDEIIEEVD